MVGDVVTVSLDVENIGHRQGEEVVQLYIRDVLASVSVPVKQLRGFVKISLDPNEKKKVVFQLISEDLMLLDRSLEWIVEPGVFDVMIGSSSKDIRLTGSFEVRK